MPEFTYYPKTPRLSSGYVITEKLDGSQGAVVIESEAWGYSPAYDDPNLVARVDGPERGEDGYPVVQYNLFAQSRNRFITPQADNFGFAAWVKANAEPLVRHLGEGRHFGEWWGHGIQRGYGLPKGERRFSLFNVDRHNPLPTLPDLQARFDSHSRGPLFGADLPELDVVPVLAHSDGDCSLRHMSLMLDRALADLSINGSHATRFDRPEGVVLFHARSRQVFKSFCDDTEKVAEVAKRPVPEMALVA